MSLMMLAASSMEPKSVTLTGNQTWVAPSNIGMLAEIIGTGGSGAPGQAYYDVTETVTVVYDSPEYGTGGTQSSVTRIYPPSTPTDGCLTPIYYPEDHATIEKCYSHTTGTEPATTGSPATGFSKTFPGGFSGAATPVTYSNESIAPGGSYVLVIPFGGSIVVKYYG